MANESKIDDAPEGEIESCPLLVVPPHCTCDDGDAVAVEGERLQSVRIPTEVQSLVERQLNSDSDFGAEEENMRELEDRSGLKHITHILPEASSDDNGGFDACNEYGYKYVDSDYDGKSSMAYEAKEPLAASDVAEEGSNFYESASSQELGFVVNLLGKKYDPIVDYEPRRNDESSLFWFTYRICFPEIIPYKITTDAGWGCMLRSAQMLLGQTLRMHYKDRSWKPPQSITQRRHDKFTKQIMTWFADFPSKNESIYSLHNMVAIGLAKYETLPGEWYGPSKASYVIRDLCYLEEERQKGGQVEKKMFRVHVASQGTVYKDTVNDLMTKSQGLKQNKELKETKDFLEPPTHPLDPNYLNDSTDRSKRESIRWDTSLLLLVPVRLGLENFNEDYTLQLAHVFSFSQCVGILGGRPRGARWFYGAASDGAKIYGLDPHTIQSCPEQSLVKLPNGRSKKTISITDDYLRSVHTTNPECIKPTGLDPSLALGFYCRDHDDFNSLCDSLNSWKNEHPGKPDIFTVAEKVPDYSSNVSHAMTEMMMSMSAVDISDEGGNMNQVDDDDDFVLL